MNAFMILLVDKAWNGFHLNMYKFLYLDLYLIRCKLQIILDNY